MPLNKNALIVFQKNAVLGKVKTRLGDCIGALEALKIYQSLLSLTYREIKLLKVVDVFVYFSTEIENTHPLSDTMNYFPRIQEGEDLGAKMSKAFKEVFSLGYEKILIIGTDCPEITAEIIQQGFETLGTDHQAVIGEAKDGGYYLLGFMDGFQKEFFEDIPWSTSSVSQKTIEKFQELKTTYACLSILRDLDTFEDWEQTRHLL